MNATGENTHGGSGDDRPVTLDPKVNLTLLVFSVLLVGFDPQGFDHVVAAIAATVSVAALATRHGDRIGVWLIVAGTAIPALVMVLRERWR